MPIYWNDKRFVETGASTIKRAVLGFAVTKDEELQIETSAPNGGPFRRCGLQTP